MLSGGGKGSARGKVLALCQRGAMYRVGNARPNAVLMLAYGEEGR